MFMYIPLAYFFFLAAALVAFGFATAWTAQALNLKPHTLSRARKLSAAALTWGVCAAALLAPFLGAADWLGGGAAL